MGSRRSVLLTGVTGYVGGTVLTTLLKSTDKTVQSLNINTLVRRQDQAQRLADQGIKSVTLEGGLDDVQGLVNLASQHDIVLHCASGFHTASAEALIRGLARHRHENAGINPIYIHLSGTNNLSVGDITGRRGEYTTFSDKSPGIYEYELERETERPYPQRSTNVKVVQTGEETGIKTYFVMPPLIYGRGTGIFNQRSEQIPVLVRNALKMGQSEYVSPGHSTIGHVHAEDVATLFEAVLVCAMSDPSLPSGRNGYYFAATGQHTWLQVADMIASEGYKLGLLHSDHAVPISVSEAAQKLSNGNEADVEYSYGSSENTLPEKSYVIGWTPSRLGDSWESNILEEMLVIHNEINRV